MGDDGSSVWWIARLHPPKEGQEWSRILGNAVVRPGGELELSNLSLFTGTILDQEQVALGG